MNHIKCKYKVLYLIRISIIAELPLNVRTLICPAVLSSSTEAAGITACEEEETPLIGVENDDIINCI
jgi:hypothetical protein